MTLENYVRFEKDVEKVLRFKPESFRIEPREIIDPATKIRKTLNSAVIDVIEEAGAKVTKTMSAVSEKFAASLQAAHDNGTLYRYKVGIKVTGEGYGREYQIRFF